MNFNKIITTCLISIIIIGSGYLVFQKYMDLHNNKNTDEHIQTKVTSDDDTSSDQDVVIQINCKCGDWCDVFGCYCNTCMGNCEVGCGSSDNLCNSGSCVNDMCYISGCGCGVESCGACYGCDEANGTACDSNTQCSSGNCEAGSCEACIEICEPGNDFCQLGCTNDGQCCTGTYCDTSSGYCYGCYASQAPCTSNGMCCSGVCNSDDLCS